MVRRPDLRWLAVAVALVLGVAVVVGVMTVRFANAPANHAPISDYGPPPKGVPLVYTIDPRNHSWLLGFDWQGRPRATVKPSLDPYFQGMGMAPDGSAFQVFDVATVNGVIYLDRLGHLISGQTAPLDHTWACTSDCGAQWGDDGQRLCSVTYNRQTLQWSLSTVVPGQAARLVAVLPSDIAGAPVACSFRNDLAIMVHTTLWAAGPDLAPSEASMIRLSDGKLIDRWTYAKNALTSVVASSDGAYIAESSMKSEGPSAYPGGAASTLIRRVADRAVVATLDGSLKVLAFSGNGASVLVSTRPICGSIDNGIGSADQAIIDWKSGRTIWQYDGPDALGDYTAQPGASGFAFALRAPTAGLVDSACGPLVKTDDGLENLVIVRGDGSTIPIAGRYRTIWSTHLV